MSGGRFVVRLQDGLGNQLFQYALGRQLAEKNRARVIFDTTWYNIENAPTKPRALALLDFNVSGKFKSDPGFRDFWIRPTRLARIWWRIEQGFLPPHLRRYVGQDLRKVQRSGRMFDPRVMRVRPDSYLAGWWISPRYFQSAGDSIRQELVLRIAYSGKALNATERIEACESVAIHIRRGDYINHPEIGILDLEYYRRSIGLIQRRLKNPKFFVFSDEPNAARNLLLQVIPDFEVVELEHGISPSVDMCVMARCRHFIIANSTFSWWAAWLGRDSGKIVIAPRFWYSGSKIIIEDVYPDEWIKAE